MTGPVRSCAVRSRGVRARGRRTQSGTAALELTLLAPVLLLILLFVVGLGRMAHARQEVEAVAADSAREASLHRDRSSAAAAAKAAAQRSLGQHGLSCIDNEVRVDVSGFEPGGVVRVAVTCRASLADVAMTGLPGSKQFTASSVVPIESFRAE